MQDFTPALELSQKVHVVVPGEPGVQTFEARLVLHVATRQPTPEEEMALVRASLVGWDGVTGEDGTPIPYSEAERDRLLAMPFVLLAVAEAIRQAADRTRARAAALNRALAAEPAPEVH